MKILMIVLKVAFFEMYVSDPTFIFLFSLKILSFFGIKKPF